MFSKLLLPFFLCLSLTIYGQNNRIWGLEYSAKGGFLLAHTPSMNHLPKQHVHAQEFSFIRMPSLNKAWCSRLSYPLVGATFYTGNLGNDAVLGKSSGVYGFMKFRLDPGLHRHKFYFKFGVGGAYVTKIHSIENNPKNNAISSHWNYLLNTTLGYEYLFPGHIYIGAGIDFMHMSNAAFKAPNLGLNIPQIKINLGFLLHPKKLDVQLFKQDTITSLNSKWRVLVQGMYSQKEISAYPGFKFPVYAGNLLVQHKLNSTLYYETGMDVMWNTSDRTLRQEKKIQDSLLLKVGGYVGVTLPLERLQFNLGLGAYMYDPHSLNGIFYQRLGLRYFLLKPLFVSLTLKSHWFNADYAEFGIGVRI